MPNWFRLFIQYRLTFLYSLLIITAREICLLQKNFLFLFDRTCFIMNNSRDSSPSGELGDLPGPELLRDRIWCSPCAVLHFIIFIGLVVSPQRCIGGHARRFSFRKCRHGALHCGVRREVSVPIPEQPGTHKFIMKVCPASKSWRIITGSFAFKLPQSVGPQALCQALYWFSQRTPLDPARINTGIKRNTLWKICFQIRVALQDITISLNYAELLGQGNTVVLIDKTFITKRKVNRASFSVGRPRATRHTLLHSLSLIGHRSDPRGARSLKLLAIAAGQLLKLRFGVKLRPARRF